MRRPLVIYHADCRDGFTAAWVAYRKFRDEAYYIAVKYGEPLDLNIQDRDVYILDFSYPRSVLEQMHNSAKSLIVLDHHKTAQEDLAGLPYAVFDMNRSGAGLAWDYFFPNEKRRWIVDYVEDRDLWRFNLPNSRELNAVIGCTPMTFEAWDELNGNINLNPLIEQGKAILQYQDELVRAISKNAAYVHSEHIAFAYVNTPILQSEVLAHLAIGQDFAVSWADQADGGRSFSFRSSRDGLDVGELARRMGGGGHKHAAGYHITGAEAAYYQKTLKYTLSDIGTLASSIKEQRNKMAAILNRIFNIVPKV